MASPSVTYTFSNSTTADATQVNQNFTDLINGASDGTKDYSINALTCAGTATLNGHINLGNAAADDLTITASLASSLSIKTTNSFNIGSSTLGLASIYFGSSGGAFTTRLLGGAAAASYTITLPAAAPTIPGSVMAFTTGGVATFEQKNVGSVVAKSGDYTITTTDGYDTILVTTSTSTVTITLPAASSSVGRRICVKKVDTAAGKVVVARAGSDTIEDAARTSVQVAFQGDAIQLIGSTTSKWDFQGSHYQSFSEEAPTITNAGTGPSGLVKGIRNGRAVTITTSMSSGTSPSTGVPMSMTTPIPVDFRPANSVAITAEMVTTSDSWYQMVIATSGSIDFYRYNLAGAQDIAIANWPASSTFKFHAAYVMY